MKALDKISLFVILPIGIIGIGFLVFFLKDGNGGSRDFLAANPPSKGKIESNTGSRSADSNVQPEVTEQPHDTEPTPIAASQTVVIEGTDDHGDRFTLRLSKIERHGKEIEMRLSTATTERADAALYTVAFNISVKRATPRKDPYFDPHWVKISNSEGSLAYEIVGFTTLDYLYVGQASINESLVDLEGDGRIIFAAPATEKYFHASYLGSQRKALPVATEILTNR